MDRPDAFRGKYFSILGDSLSAFEGSVPEGWRSFYRGEVRSATGVLTAEDTWWGRTLKVLEGRLLCNASYSGSRVTRLPGARALFPSACDDRRIAALGKDGRSPDYILAYIGANDWGNGVPLEPPPEGGDAVDFFAPACRLMLDKLRAAYPDATVFLSTLNASYMPSDRSFVFPQARGGIRLEDYNDAIRGICAQYAEGGDGAFAGAGKRGGSAGAGKGGVKLMDVASYRLPHATVEGFHPTAVGMETLATVALRILLGENAAVLDCPDGQHRFTAIDRCGGRTEYVCKYCAKRMMTEDRNV